MPGAACGRESRGSPNSKKRPGAIDGQTCAGLARLPGYGKARPRRASLGTSSYGPAPSCGALKRGETGGRGEESKDRREAKLFGSGKKKKTGCCRGPKRRASSTSSKGRDQSRGGNARRWRSEEITGVSQKSGASHAQTLRDSPRVVLNRDE